MVRHAVRGRVVVIRGEKTSALICGDAGDAGPVLIARSDVDVKWALTLPEALAVIRNVRLDVCITREPFAREIISAIANPTAEPPVIVLLDPAGKKKANDREAKYRPGARAVVPADDRAAVLDVCSQLTGLSFRLRPRVPFARFVEVTIGTDRQLVETVDLSASGICLRDSPKKEIGTVIRLSLDAVTPPIQLEAVLIRTYARAGETRSGFAFTNLAGDAGKKVAELVERELENAPPPPSTMDLTVDREESVPIELVSALAWRGSRRLAGLKKPPVGLKRIAGELTPLERGALAGGTVPVWVERALDLRLLLASGRGAALKNEVLQLCASLSESSSTADDAQRVQIASVRGGLLHDLSVATPGGWAPTAGAIQAAREHHSGDVDADPEIIAIVSAPTQPAESFVTADAYFKKVMASVGGDKEKAAKVLGLTKAQLSRMLR